MDKMRFEEFKNEVVGKIKEFLPESFAKADVELQTVTKNNDLKLTGLVIRSSESNICPTIYLERFFEKYEAGAEMSEILKMIAETRVNHEVTEQFDVAQIADFDQAKGKIVPRLVNADMNAVLLEGRPHKLIADLACTYHILLNQSGEGTSSVAVTNELMSNWHTSLEELHKIAIANLSKVLPSTFQGMSEVMAEMMGANEAELAQMGMNPGEEQLYVLSNNLKVNGAAAILDFEMMKKIIEKIGEFFILPSSIHEVLVVPKMTGMDVESLESMVCEVNATQVQLEERLSNHIYTYNLEDGLKIA